MKNLIILILLMFSAISIAQVDSVRVTWTDPTSVNAEMLYVYGDTTENATTLRDSSALLSEVWYWQPPTAGLWYFRMRARTADYTYSSYSNEDTVTTSGGGGSSLPTENLIWFVDDASLSNGAVSVWAPETGIDTLFQATAGNQPTKTDSGVVFDGTDWLRAGGAFAEPPQTMDITASFSMVLVVKIVDTAGTSQNFLSIQDTAANIASIAIQTNRLTASYYDGTTQTSSDIHSSSLLNSTVCIIATRSVANGIRIYFDGVLQTETSSYLGLLTDQALLMMGAYDSGADAVVRNGTIFRLGALYSEEVDQTKVNAIMASDEITGKLN